MASSLHLNPIDGALTTFDATPTPIIVIPAIDPNVSLRINVTVTCSKPDNSDFKSWDQVLLVSKTAGGTPSMGMAAMNAVAPTGSLGSSSWTLSTAFDPNNIFINVVGQAASTINWFATASAIAVMGD